MQDIFHPILNNNSIFKIYQSKDESFLYSILAAIYSQKIEKNFFHQPIVQHCSFRLKGLKESRERRQDIWLESLERCGRERKTRGERLKLGRRATMACQPGPDRPSHRSAHLLQRQTIHSAFFLRAYPSLWVDTLLCPSHRNGFRLTVRFLSSL